MIALTARDFRAAETPRHHGFDTFRARLHGTAYTAFHGAPERHALFKLLRDIFSHKLRVHVKVFNLNNVEVDGFAARDFLDVAAHFFNFSTLRSDKNTRFCRVNINLDVFCAALNLNQ